MIKEPAAPTVALGQEAFVVVTTDGEVVRTMVAAISMRGYTFANGLYSGRTHWFDYDQAVGAAVAGIKEREKRLRAELRSLARRRKVLGSAEHKAAVFAAPYRFADPRQIEKRDRTRHLKQVAVPESYLRPGERVYMVVTPTTRERYGAYRPYPHFVLEVEVSTVCLRADGSVHYTFSTPFEVNEIYHLKDKAVRALQSSLGPEASGNVPYVSHEQEQQGIADTDDIPF
jgi:hypothetical protein